MDGLDDSSSVESTCQLSSASNAVDRHSSNAIVRNIAESVADDPSSSLIVDALSNPENDGSTTNRHRNGSNWKGINPSKLPVDYLLFRALSICRSGCPLSVLLPTIISSDVLILQCRYPPCLPMAIA